MIEGTISQVDGVDFYTNIRILEPDEKIGGMGVHRITRDTREHNPEFMRSIRAMGLREVGYDLSYRSFLYAESTKSYITIKMVQFSLRLYWWNIRFLYDNARFFKKIPEGECFSWAYFTPYTWFKGLRK